MVSTQTDFLALAEREKQTDVSSLDSVLGVSDHKAIGRLYISSAILILIASLGLAVVSSFELMDLASLRFVKDADQFVQLLSLSKEALLFGGVIPLLVGLGLYLVPLQVGVARLAFSRGAAASFWSWFLGFILFVTSYVFNGGPAGGREDFVALWLLSLGLMIVSLIWAMVCIAVTVLGSRAQGMTIERTPYTSWSFAVFSIIGCVSFPIVLAEILLSYIRLRYGHIALESTEQLFVLVTPLLSAPFIFWLALPLLGFFVDIVGVHTQKPVVFTRTIIGLIGLFGAASFLGVLSSFGSLRAYESNAFLTACIGLALLSAFGVLLVSAKSLISGAKARSVPLFGAVCSLLLVLLAGVFAGIDSLTQAVSSFDEDVLNLNALSQRSTEVDISTMNKSVVGYGGIFALLLGATLVGSFAALHHWSVKIWGRQLRSSFGLLSVLLAFFGSLLWASGQIGLSMLNESQDSFSVLSAGVNPLVGYSPGILDFLTVAGSLLLLASVCLLLLSMIFLSTAKEVGSAASRWKGLTLEWAVASPPLEENFAVPPVVTSAFPLLDENVFKKNDASGNVGYLEEASAPKALSAGSDSGK